MKRVGFLKRKYKLLLALFIVIVLLFVYNKYTYSFEYTDGEFFKGPLKSPTGKYTANAYYQTYGGAAGGVNVWVNITFNNEKKKIKTVYYSDAKSNFWMQWKGKETLFINNDEPDLPSENRSIELKIGKEIYDSSGAVCSSWKMKDEYETCYERD